MVLSWYLMVNSPVGNVYNSVAHGPQPCNHMVQGLVIYVQVPVEYGIEYINSYSTAR